MENNNSKFKIIYAVALSAIVSVIFITVITIVADLYLPFKGWLKNVFSHHWVGKSVLTGVIFLGVSILTLFLPISPDEEKIIKALKCLVWLTILGTLAILGFFIYEYL